MKERTHVYPDKTHRASYGNLEEIRSVHPESTHMSEQEKRIIETYKEVVEFYNLVKSDADISYADAQIEGMEKMAKAFGYTLYAHHRNGCIGLEYDHITIAKDGDILIEIPV